MFSAPHPLASDCWHEQRHAHSSLCAIQAVSVGGGLFSSHGAIVVQQDGARISNPIDEDSYSMSTQVAALYVDPRGSYIGLPGIDPWDEARDARAYQGPYPVVAHPPCQRWGALAAVNFARWGGEHNKPGNDGGCFAAALVAVNRWGGVLEHPAKTRAWSVYGLEKPYGTGWRRSGCGWVCEVWQSAYGHRANKATWLYYHGSIDPMDLRWDRPVGTHQIGFQDQRGKGANKPTLGKREANSTPPEFRDVLISIAKMAKKGGEA